MPALCFRSAPKHFFGSGMALCLAAIFTGCGPEAIGVESCRKIETARCDAAISCGFSEEEVADCKLIYSDQCLHGIENAEHRPTEKETEACVAAISNTAKCAADDVKNMSACGDAKVVGGAGTRTPCEIVLSKAHELSACSFTKAAPAEENASGGGGSAGAGGKGGAGGS